jgi:hypothetical protein
MIFAKANVEVDSAIEVAEVQVGAHQEVAVPQEAVEEECGGVLRQVPRL